MIKSITSLSHGVKHIQFNIRAYFPKFQKAKRHTWKSLAAHKLRTSALTTRPCADKDIGYCNILLYKQKINILLFDEERICTVS